MMVLSPLGPYRKSPCTCAASSENHRKNSAAYSDSPMASPQALPFSRAIKRAQSSISAVMMSNALRKISARERAEDTPHVWKASYAAPTACRPSWGVASPISASEPRVAGLITSR